MIRRMIPGLAPNGGRGLLGGFRPMPVQARGIPQRPVALPVGVGRPILPVTKLGVPVRPILGSMKQGGKVKKTGAYNLHAGERVVTGDVESHEYDFRKHRGGRKNNG